MRLASLLAHEKDTRPANLPMERHGLKLTIEHPRGTQRTLYNDEGKKVYSVHMHHHYGYFNGTKGRDGDEVDVMVGPLKDAKEVYVVHMKDMGPDPAEREDEDKVMIGFPTADAAKRAFLLHYPPDFYEGLTALPVATFKNKLAQAQLPYRKKKLTARAIVAAISRRKENAEVRSQSGHLAAAHTEHAGSGRSSVAGRLPGGVRVVIDEDKKKQKHTVGTLGGSKDRKCPKCGSDQVGLLPPDFETWRCQDCGKTFEIKATTLGESFKREHKRLVRILRHGDKKERHKEALKQQKELEARSPLASATETFTISTSPEVMARFKRFLRHVQWCSLVGHTCTVAMDIDGDGPDVFYVDKPNVKHEKGKVVEHGQRRVEMVQSPAFD